MKKPEAIDPSKVIIIPRPPVAGTAENVTKKEADSAPKAESAVSQKESEAAPEAISPKTVK